MAKINKPLLSLSAIGALGKHLVFRKRGLGTVAQQTPRPVDRRSFAQLQWRTMYQKAIALWHLLSPTEKAAWERQATPRHMTGFAYFISQALKPNPGIYLPLAGGTMQGDVNFCGHKILNLPAPTADEEPTRKSDLAAHAGMKAAIHGLKGEVGFSVYPTSTQIIQTVTNTLMEFDTAEWNVGSYFDLSNERFKPLIPGKYCFMSAVSYENMSDTDRYLLFLRKNGSTIKYLSWHSAAVAFNPCIQGSAIAYANGTTDYFNLYTWHDNVMARNTRVGPIFTYFQGFLIPQT